MNERRREGILRAFLGEVPVPGDPDQGGHDPAPFVAERPSNGRLDGGHARGGYISQSGRTSIEPDRAPGILAATDIASSRFWQSTR